MQGARVGQMFMFQLMTAKQPPNKGSTIQSRDSDRCAMRQITFFFFSFSWSRIGRLDVSTRTICSTFLREYNTFCRRSVRVSWFNMAFDGSNSAGRRWLTKGINTRHNAITIVHSRVKLLVVNQCFATVFLLLICAFLHRSFQSHFLFHLSCSLQD